MRFSGCALLITAALQHGTHGFHMMPTQRIASHNIFVPSLCSKCYIRKSSSVSSSSSSWQLHSTEKNNVEEVDPRDSPNDYFYSIYSGNKKVTASNDDVDPLKMENVKNDFSGTPESSLGQLRSTEKNNIEEFDPRRSPHEYSNGNDDDDPLKMENVKNDLENVKNDLENVKNDFSGASDYLSGLQRSTEKNNIDDFDPRRSPHEYSNGIDSNSEKSAASNDDDDPLRMKNVKNDFNGASEQDYKAEKALFTGDWSASTHSDESAAAIPDSPTANDDEFDPRVSPHAYSNGASSKPVLQNSSTTTSSSSPPPRIGVLLIDHGSKRPSSNDHLLKVASLYQSKAPSNVVVRAAHMEIVAPSILDGIGALWKEDGVDKIICHPYFLSPGRHVAEDVPELIHGAVLEMNGAEVEEGKVWDGKEGLFLGGEGGDVVVEVIMTEPVGSNINRMVDIIGEMVEGSLGGDVIGARSVGVKKENIGGFFGNVQRMMDEQL